MENWLWAGGRPDSSLREENDDKNDREFDEGLYERLKDEDVATDGEAEAGPGSLGCLERCRDEIADGLSDLEECPAKRDGERKGRERDVP